MSTYGEINPGEADNKDPYYEMAVKSCKKEYIKGYRINYLFDKYPEIDEIRHLLDWNNYRDDIERAYFSESDEEALNILEEYREKLKKEGISEFEDWLNIEASKRNDIIW
jgi:hypothetical protein